MRLGDQNLASNVDGAEPEDYDIESFIKHDDFDHLTKENDIGLIKLANNVKFSKFIRPACLQQLNRIDGEISIVTRWFGSETLRRLTMNISPPASCYSIYDGDLFKTQICATGFVCKLKFIE